MKSLLVRYLEVCINSLAAFGFTHQLQIPEDFQECRQSTADHRMIVNKHDTNGFGWGSFYRVCFSIFSNGGQVQSRDQAGS